MVSERVPNPIKIVAWFMAAKNVIKFLNDDTTYKLGEAVIKASNFEKFPLSKGNRVEVGINEGVVTYLRKQKNDTPKEPEGHGSEEAYEPTPEEEAPKVAPSNSSSVPQNSTPSSDAKELTVYAVASNKKVVKFFETKEAGWFQIDESIQAQDYKVIGLEAKNKANVVIVENKVVSFVKVTSEPAESTKTATSSPDNDKTEPTPVQAVQTPVQAPKKEWKPYSSQDNDAKQKSIEAQASVNSACEVAGQVAAAITTTSRKDDGSIAPPTANVINNIIRAIAESNFALIQELKAK